MGKRSGKAGRYSVKVPCSVCGREVSPQGMVGHMRTHSGATPASKESKRRATSEAKPAASIAEANIVAISPKRFEMSSALLWQAREAAIREWNWPADISPEDFLDTWLYESFKQRGIILGGYQVVRKGRD